MSKATEIAKGWVDHAKREKLKRRTIRYQNHQASYLAGVFAVLGHETPPIITIYALSGRDLHDLAHEPELV